MASVYLLTGTQPGRRLGRPVAAPQRACVAPARRAAAADVARVPRLLSAAYVSLVDVPPWTIFDDPGPGAAAISVAAVALAAAVAAGLAPPRRRSAPRPACLPGSPRCVRGSCGTARGSERRSSSPAPRPARTPPPSPSSRSRSAPATSPRRSSRARSERSCRLSPRAAARRSRRPPGPRGSASSCSSRLAFDVPEFAHEAVNLAPTAGGRSSRRRRACSPGATPSSCSSGIPRPPVVAAAAGARRVGRRRGRDRADLASRGRAHPPRGSAGGSSSLPFVYFGLAARAFRSERHRDLSTWLWVLGTASAPRRRDARRGRRDLDRDRVRGHCDRPRAAGRAAARGAPLVGRNRHRLCDERRRARLVPAAEPLLRRHGGARSGALGRPRLPGSRGRPPSHRCPAADAWIDPILGSGALSPLCEPPRAGAAPLRRLRRDRLRAWARRGERRLGADRAHAPRRGPAARRAAAPLRRPLPLRPQPGQDLPLRPQRAQLGRASPVLHRGGRTRARRRVLPAAAGARTSTRGGRHTP